MDALVSHLEHGDSDNAPKAAVIENFETSLSYRREGPSFAAPEENSKDAGFVDHSLRPYLYLWALPKENKNSHYLVGAENSTVDIWLVPKGTVKERTEVHELRCGRDDASGVGGEGFRPRKGGIRVE